MRDLTEGKPQDAWMISELQRIRSLELEAHPNTQELTDRLDAEALLQHQVAERQSVLRLTPNSLPPSKKTSVYASLAKLINGCRVTTKMRRLVAQLLEPLLRRVEDHALLEKVRQTLGASTWRNQNQAQVSSAERGRHRVQKVRAKWVVIEAL